MLVHLLFASFVVLYTLQVVKFLFEMAAGRSKSDTDLDRDVERGAAITSAASLDIERSTQVFNVSEQSSKVPTSSLNVFRGTAETCKVSGKVRLEDVSPSSEGNETETESISGSDTSPTAKMKKDIVKLAAPAVLHAIAAANQRAASSSACASDEPESESSKVSNLERQEQRRSDEDAESVHSAASTSSTQQSCDVARAAARRARSAVTTCRRAVELLNYLEITGDSNNSIAVQRMGNFPEGCPEYNAYRDHVDHCSKIINSLREKVPPLNAIAATLEQGAVAADEAADHAAEVAGEESIEAKRRKFLACWETNNLNAALSVALSLEYSALKAITKYHSLLTTEPNIVLHEDSSNEFNPQCENQDRKTKYGLAMSLVVGLALLGTLALFDRGSDAFGAILTSGLILALIPSAYCVFKVVSCWKSRRRGNETAEASVRMQVLSVNERLSAVEECLRQENMPLPSDSESGGGSQETLDVADA